METKIDIVALATWGVLHLGHLGATPAAANAFDTAIIDTVDDFLAQFGELITYYPAGAIGDQIVGSGDILAISTFGIWGAELGGSSTPRAITAIVDREQPGEMDSVPYGTSNHAIITVANDATKGISSSEVDTGGDKVALPIRLGETAKKCRVTKVVAQDAGMLRLEVR